MPTLTNKSCSRFAHTFSSLSTTPKYTRMATFFEKNKKNFQDVTIVEGKVDTPEFLDASKDLVGLFGKYYFCS